MSAHHPHINLTLNFLLLHPLSLLPFLLLSLVKALKQVARLIRRRRNRKRRRRGIRKGPTTSNVGSKQPGTLNLTGSVDEVKKIKTKNLKPKFPYSLCKGDHFLRDFLSLPKVLEIWSSTSSTSTRHTGDAPSTSDIKVGKKKTTIKFPCMLCEGDHYSHLVLVWTRLLLF